MYQEGNNVVSEAMPSLSLNNEQHVHTPAHTHTHPNTYSETKEQKQNHPRPVQADEPIFCADVLTYWTVQCYDGSRRAILRWGILEQHFLVPDLENVS